MVSETATAYEAGIWHAVLNSKNLLHDFVIHLNAEIAKIWRVQR